jgi:uncharacterized protein YecT (DUF1311 family)
VFCVPQTTDEQTIMKKNLFNFLIIFSFISCNSEKNNYGVILKNLDSKHQTCLDKGEAMMLCSYAYSKQMDSLLNVVYKDLMKGYNEDQQNKLRTEERQWIKKRDQELKKVYSTVNKLRETNEFVPQDERMFAYAEEANFVRKRVLELIDDYEKQSKNK